MFCFLSSYSHPLPKDQSILEYSEQTGKGYYPQQPNRVLIHKPPRLRLIIPEEVVVQPRFTVGILILQAEGLVNSAVGFTGFEDESRFAVKAYVKKLFKFF